MKNKIVFFLFGLGWVLLALFLVSGNFYKKFANQSDSSFFAPVAWENHLQVFKGAVQCTLNSEEFMERKQQLKEEVFSKVVKKEEVKNGFIYYFDDNDVVLKSAVEFIQKEKACCPFFKFDLSILPFGHGFAVQISGSEEAFLFLKEVENIES